MSYVHIYKTHLLGDEDITNWPAERGDFAMIIKHNLYRYTYLT